MRDARDVVQRFYDAFSSSDLDAALECVSDDVENIDPTGTIIGKDGFGQFLAGFKAAAPDAALTAIRWFGEGDVVALEGLFTGTFTGPLATPQGELPPTGNRFELPYAEVNEVQDGKIRWHRVYYDQMNLMAAMGLTPPQGS